MKTLSLTITVTALLGWFGPSLDLDDHGLEQAIAADLEEAQQQAEREARHARAMSLMCGSENAVAVPIADGSVRCKTKHGRNTRTLLAGVRP